MDNKPKDQSDSMNPEQNSENIDMPTRTSENPDIASSVNPEHSSDSIDMSTEAPDTVSSLDSEQSSDTVDVLAKEPGVPDTAMFSDSNTPPPPVFPSESKPQGDPSGSDTPPPTDTPSSSASSSSPVDDGGKKNIGLMIGALLVLMFAFFALIYYFVLRQSPEPEQPEQQVQVENFIPSPTEVVTPTPELTEEAAESIDIGSPEADLAPIDIDLESL